jgi:GT2 family glycosyltransferase
MVSAGTSLSIVIVNYRRADLLEQALHALRASGRQPDEVVAVDVAPTAPLSFSLEPHERLLSFDDNPGYAAACNRGAAQTSGDWVLFMNADVFVAEDCIGGVITEAESDPGIGVATCRLMKPDGHLDHACHRGIPSVRDSLAYKAGLDRLLPRSRRLGHYRLTWLDPTETHDVEACSGAFLLIRRGALMALHGWDEGYRFYAEDLDLCARVTAAGWRIRYVGTQTAVHLKGSSSHLHRRSRELAPEERATRRDAHAAAIDSHERFYEQHLERDTARVARPLVRLMFAAQRRRARLSG